MASSAQVELFDSLVEKRQFPNSLNPVELRAEFKELTTKNASQWIEKALALPARAEGDSGPTVPAPF